PTGADATKPSPSDVITRKEPAQDTKYDWSTKKVFLMVSLSCPVRPGRRKGFRRPGNVMKSGARPTVSSEKRK
ncbi:hypothetical protein ACFW9I_36990, partial [[Kitasatospora] papulosa]|uniref:hypothetical protein n=1 Tax=[Kitasatospora] papulosa TaxID=1464011 RepID=UPI00368A6549